MQNKLSEEKQRVLDILRELQPDSEEYRATAENLKLVCDIENQKSHRTVSSEAILAAATNIAGIVMILSYEHLHVVTSKAISFVKK